MKKLIFLIIVLFISIIQISYAGGFRNSTTFALGISRTAGCTQFTQVSLSSISITITSKTSATISLNISAGSYNASTSIDGSINGTTIDFGTKTISSSGCSANAAINIRLTCSISSFGGNSVNCFLRGVATGAFSGDNTAGSVILTYFNGSDGGARAVVYSPSGNPKSSGAVCTSDIIDVQLFGDNYKEVQLYLNGTPLGSNVPTDNTFSVHQGYIKFTLAEKGITSDGSITISLDVNGSRTTYATFQAYSPITNTNVVSASKPVSCYGESVDFKVIVPSGINFAWADGYGVDRSPRPVNDSKEYYVIMSKSGGTCQTQSNRVSIQAIPNFNASVSPDRTQACEEQTIQINANPNDANQYNYAWSTGANGSSISVTQNGNYNVTITPKSGGCASKTSNTVNNLSFEKKITGENILLTNNKTKAIFCKDDANITLSATASDLTNVNYQWSGPKSGNTKDLVIESGGDYFLQLSRGACSTSPKKITVIGKINPTFVLNPNDAQICKGDKISLTTNPNNSDYGYQWFGGIDGKTDLKINSANYEANDGGLYRVVLNPNGGNCNATTGVYEVNQLVKADAPITNFQITGRKANEIVPICNANGISLQAISDGDVSISWNGGTKILRVNSLSNINDERTYTAKFERGKCTQTITVTTKKQNLLANIKSPIDVTRKYITCSDNTDFKLVAESNFTDASIKWKDSNDPNFSNTNKEFAPTKAGKYYAVANLAECGTADSDPTKTVEIILPPDFKVNILSQLTNPICDGTTQTFTAIPTYTSFAGIYTWIPNLSTNNILKSTSIGTYALTIQQDGCKASTTASISTKASKPTITLVDFFSLFASNDTENREWLFKNSPLSNDPTLYNSLSPSETGVSLTASKIGSYILKGNRNGCGIAYSDPIEIKVVTLANESSNSNMLKVYPNPSTNYLTIENNSLNFLQNFVIELRNTSGILVKYWHQNEKSKEYSIDDLSTGTYYLIFNQNNNRIVKKIIKL